MAALFSLTGGAAAPELETTEWKLKGSSAALSDARPDVRQEALRKLGALKFTRAIPQIVKQLEDPAPEVRIAAIEALGAMGQSALSYAPKIAVFLTGREEAFRPPAISALGAMGAAAQGYAPSIAALLRERDSEIRRRAVIALDAIGPPAQEHLPTVRNLLNDPDQHVSAAAAVAQCKMSGPVQDQVSALAALINSPAIATRLAAIKALGAFGETAAAQAPALIALAGDPQVDDLIRNEALTALGEMGATARGHAPAIAGILNNPQSQSLDGGDSVREAAAKTIAAIGASEYARDLAGLLRSRNVNLRMETVRALIKLRDAAGPLLPSLNQMANNPQEPAPIRNAALLTVCSLDSGDETCPTKIIALLNEREAPIREVAGEALTTMAPLKLGETLNILAPIYDQPSLAGELRFLAHYLGGGRPAVETLLRWLRQSAETSPHKLPRQQAAETLQYFQEAWGEQSLAKPVRGELARRIVDLSLSTEWKDDDLKLLENSELSLSQSGSVDEAAIVNGQIRAIKGSWRSWFSDWWPRFGWGLLAHVSFWGALIWLYPKSPQIQAIIFWNPWVRRITGLGYVGLALAWVPFLRKKLFVVFKESLLSDAAIDSLKHENYFTESEVKLKLQPEEAARPIKQAIPEIRKQLVLEGESGLGKSMFLRDLVNCSERVVVYLPATKCKDGVIEAIQAKLHGPAKDPDFLRHLIFSGALDICIDGLNEVSPDTRARITEFAGTFFQGNIIMATQPILWSPPSLATVFVMKPLRADKIKSFLLSRQKNLPPDATVSGANYEQACQSYLDEALSDQQPAELHKSAELILSNPMDLTVVAQMLSRGQSPQLFRLLEQQYEVMAEDYKRINVSADFPLRRFSEQVCELQLKEQSALPKGEFLRELQCLERHKMVGARHSQGQDGESKEWWFRHDKIRDFFIAQTFLGKNNSLRKERLRDPRFRGVYLLLATLLPLDEAGELREMLIQDAAESGDHTLSDPYIKLMRSR